MKTTIKILLLLLFSIGAIAGVLVFVKTRVAPPSNIKLVDQYFENIKSNFESFDSIKDFTHSRKEYSRLDDKLKRFLSENVIDQETSDEYRKKIDASFGSSLSSYGFELLQKSFWPEKNLNELLKMLTSLRVDKLSNGEPAVNTDFIQSANRLSAIIDEYHTALRLSRNTSFSGVSDASAKISKAENYRTKEYLSNNADLVNALKALSGKLAQSHYNHVSGIVGTLGGYANVDKDYYIKTLIPRADNAISEYKSTKIYGGGKPDISSIESRAANYVTEAMNYYSDGDN